MAKKRKKRRKKFFLRRPKSVITDIPVAYKRMYEGYKKKMMSIVTEFLETELGVIVEWTKDVMNARRKLRSIVIYLALVFGGTAIALYGIGEYVGYLCPQLVKGLSHLLIGLIAIAAAVMYRKQTKNELF